MFDERLSKAVLIFLSPEKTLTRLTYVNPQSSVLVGLPLWRAYPGVKNKS
jgi:hypothetical protein